MWIESRDRFVWLFIHWYLVLIGTWEERTVSSVQRLTVIGVSLYAQIEQSEVYVLIPS